MLQRWVLIIDLEIAGTCSCFFAYIGCIVVECLMYKSLRCFVILRESESPFTWAA